MMRKTAEAEHIIRQKQVTEKKKKKVMRKQNN